jgi:hypothetical protein
VGWRRLLGKEFPRLGKGQDRLGPPLTPAALNRRLAQAGAADRSERRRKAFAPAPSPYPGPHTARLLAALSPEERRRIALRLQDERRGLECRDVEWPAGTALARIPEPCDWTPPEVRRLFEQALCPRPDAWADEWSRDAERALEIPLTAAGEVTTQERADLAPYLRRALALATGHRGPGDEHPRERVAARLRTLLDLPGEVEELLPDTAYAVAARCGLGADFYDPGVLALLRLVAESDGVRPGYPWLGSVRELLTQSAAARRAVPVLLDAAAGRPTCPAAQAHLGPLSADDGRALAALAWAACLSGEEKALTALDGALRLHASTASGEALPAHEEFLRAGLAALTALAQQPQPGAHHRVLTQKPWTKRRARVLLDELRWLPGLSEPGTLSRTIGDYTAVFTVHSAGEVRLRFRNRSGRLLTGVPSQVRAREAIGYAALRARLAELCDRVAAHRGSLAERLTADPGMPAGEWWASHLDDPVLAPLSRALVWQADTPRGPVLGLPVRRKRSAHWMLRNAAGGFHELTEDTPIRLWDASSADAVEVAPWRTELTRRHMPQPVPQLPPPHPPVAKKPRRPSTRRRKRPAAPADTVPPLHDRQDPQDTP